MRQGRDLHPLRSRHSPRFDFWGGTGAISAVWEALRADHNWDRLVLGAVPADSPLLTELPLVARRYGCCIQTSPGNEAPYFALRGFEQRLSSKFRGNLRRCFRKADDLRLERLTNPPRSAFADALEIEAMAWKGQAGTSIDADPRRSHFYRALMRVFGRRGTMSLNFATMGRRRIACLFTLEDDRTLFAAKIGYDPACAAISPGHLIVALTAEDAARRGLETFDFLGTDTHDWKLKWTNLARPHPWVTLLRPSVRGYASVAWRKVRESSVGQRTIGALQKKPSSQDDRPYSA
jgi:CelD/BcsL family acetyltransferase involved in cellulose biosynthesis